MPTCRLLNIAGDDVSASSTVPVPMYGTNQTAFGTRYAPDMASSLAANNIGGSATPSIAKGIWFGCTNAGATTITNLLSAPTNVREITIWFTDTNTTVQHNANIRLNGSVNFVSTAGASLTLCRPYNINLAWYEKCRSIP
jgi:hypothetical protein